MWRDHKISEGHDEWAKLDKMTCDHTDPHKRVKHPYPLGVPITYMESQGAFKASHFYQVRVMGDFPSFPEP